MARRGRPRHPDILTPREWEVLALVREGLSNEQIAERLDITERTARFHVSEILGKLGVATRQEAAAWQPEERPRWWTAVAFVWQRLPGRWLSPALAGALGLPVAVGIAVLVWALQNTPSAEHQPPFAPAAIPTAIVAPGAAYLIENVGLTGEYDTKDSVLKAIDPATGKDLPGRPPVHFGDHFIAALSPDGQQAAIAASATPSGPEHLLLFDMNGWQISRDLQFEQWIGWLHRSPDGRRIYVITRMGGTLEVYTVDAATGTFSKFWVGSLSEEASYLSPDGHTLYVFGSEAAGTFATAKPAKVYHARLLAIDVSSGTLRVDLGLPAIVQARLQRMSSDGYPEYESYIVGVAMSPDGHYFYALDPEGHLAVVDVEQMRIVQSTQLSHDKSESLFHRVLSAFAGTAEAKGGGIDGQRRLRVSADGLRLFETGFNYSYDTQLTQGLGFQVVDIATRAASVIDSKSYWPIRIDPSGHYLYAFDQSRAVVFDAATMKPVAEASLSQPADMLVGTEPAGSVTSPQ